MLAAFINNLTKQFFDREIVSEMYSFKKTLSLLLLFFLPLASVNIFAAAGDPISNTATISYKLFGIPKVKTATAVFIEDRKINFAVSDANGGAAVHVISEETDAVLQFAVTNTGNGVQDFLLSALNTTPNPYGSPVDNIDPVAGTVMVFVESGAAAGYQVAQDTAVYIDELVSNETRMVYVVADMPVANADDVAAIALIAQAAEGGSAGNEGLAINADDNGRTSPAGVFSNGATNMLAGIANTIPDSPATQETVFNDPAGFNPEDISTDFNQDITGNAQHSDAAAYQLVPPVILNKTVAVFDTTGGSDPHQGATLQYTIDISVGGSSPVTDLIINDVIPANTIYSDGSMILNGITQTDANDAPLDFSKAVDINAKPVTAIEVDLSQGGAVSIMPGENHVIIFEVTIK